MTQTTWVGFFISIMCILAGCATPAPETVSLGGDMPGWKLGHKQQDRLTQNTVFEYIPEAEYMGNWSKMYTVRFYAKRQDDPEAFMEQLKSKKARVCKNIQVKILDKQVDSVLYDWRIKGCKRYQDQHELARIIRGKAGLHQLAYIENSRTIPAATYREWQKKLHAAYLQTGGK